MPHRTLPYVPPNRYILRICLLPLAALFCQMMCLVATADTRADVIAQMRADAAKDKIAEDAHQKFLTTQIAKIKAVEQKINNAKNKEAVSLIVFSEFLPIADLYAQNGVSKKAIMYYNKVAKAYKQLDKAWKERLIGKKEWIEKQLKKMKAEVDKADQANQLLEARLQAIQKMPPAHPTIDTAPSQLLSDFTDTQSKTLNGAKKRAQPQHRLQQAGIGIAIIGVLLILGSVLVQRPNNRLQTGIVNDDTYYSDWPYG